MATSMNLKGPTIQSARVLDVNVNDYTLVVASQFMKKPLVGVTFMVPYAHHHNGEGIYFMPEVGSVCWICFPSDGNKPFVLGWGPPSDSGNYRGRRQDLNPGDIWLSTRDDNFIALRRGGVVQIGAGPLSQRMYLPVNNVIKDFCENYSLQTLGGDLEWTIAREETDTTGNRPALLKIRAKEFANDKDPVAELQIGSHDGDSNTILSIVVKDNKVTLKVEKDGKVSWLAESDVTWETSGIYKIKSKKDIFVEANGKVSVAAQSSFEASGSTAEMSATTGSATVKSPVQVVLNGPQVMAGGPTASQPVALAVPLMTWLASHFHMIIVPIPGTPTSPPAVPPVPNIVSTTLLATK